LHLVLRGVTHSRGVLVEHLATSFVSLPVRTLCRNCGLLLVVNELRGKSLALLEILLNPLSNQLPRSKLRLGGFLRLTLSGFAGGPLGGDRGLLFGVDLLGCGSLPLLERGLIGVANRPDSPLLLQRLVRGVLVNRLFADPLAQRGEHLGRPDRLPTSRAKCCEPGIAGFFVGLHCGSVSGRT
jgi:hypothetical protein